jgi:hypothetical protein
MEIPTKGDQIRELKAKGLRPSEIIALGIAHRTTVFRSIRSKPRKKHRSSMAVMEDVLTVCLDILRVMKKIAGEPGVLDE